MKPFTLLIERHRTEQSRVVVMAGSRDEAERLGREQADNDDMLWEESSRDVLVTTEGRR